MLVRKTSAKRFGVLFHLIIYIIFQLFYEPVLSKTMAFESTPLFTEQAMNLPSLQGIKIQPSDELQIEFLFENELNDNSKDSISRMIRIFMSGLTLSPKQIWVNLSPDEQNRVMSPLLAVTELGDIMARQDYLLKRHAAQLTHPDTATGQVFWNQNHNNAKTLSRVWIVPQEAEVFHFGSMATLGKMHLRVMSQNDYLAEQNVKHGSNVEINSHETESDTALMRTVICPALEKEVNESPDFAPLRRIYQALVLAHWFKIYHAQKLAPLNYIETAKVKGIDVADPEDVDRTYANYCQLFKKGVYNFIREEEQMSDWVPRKYFAGGLTFDPAAVRFVKKDQSGFNLNSKVKKWLAVSAAFTALLSVSQFTQAAQLVNFDPETRTAIVQLEKGDAPSVGYVFAVQQSIQKKVGYQSFIKSATQGDIRVLNTRGQDKGAYQVNKTMVLRDQYLKIKMSGSGAKQEQGSRQAVVPETSGTVLALPPRLPALAESTLTDNASGDSWDSVFDGDSQVQRPEAPRLSEIMPDGINISASGETGMRVGPQGGITNRVDFQFDRKLGAFSVYGGLRLTTQPQLKMNSQDFGMGVEGDMMNSENTMSETSPEIQKEYETETSSYLGFHRPGRDYDVFLEVQKWKNFHAGVESRPVYDQGLSYTYGLSGLGYETVEGYRYGGMLDGYLSFKLAKIFSGPASLWENTYLSLNLKMALAQEGTGLGGGVRLTYNDRWQGVVELSPFRDLPILQQAMGHHYDIYGYRLGLAYQLSERLNLLAQWVEPLGHMGQKQTPHFLLGLNWVLGDRGVNHDTRNRSVDYLRFPPAKDAPMSTLSRRNQALDSVIKTDPSIAPGGPPPENILEPRLQEQGKARGSSAVQSGLGNTVTASSQDDLQQISRRSFLGFLLAGGAMLGLSPSTGGQEIKRMEKIYKTDPATFSVCGLPVTIMSIGDKLQELHMVYIAFMYWYVVDQSNHWVNYEDPNKQNFLRMSPWQWEEFFKERIITPRHENLARIVQKKIKAEVEQSKVSVASKDEIQLDGKLFTKRFREWMDRWIIFQVLFGHGGVYPDDIKERIEKDKRAQVLVFLRRFINGEDVRRAMELKGQKINAEMSIVLQQQFDEFFNKNPGWIIEAAQIKFKAKGYALTVDGKLNEGTLKAIRKEIEGTPDRASSSIEPPGGIDFTGIDKITRWQVSAPEGNSYWSPLGSEVTGMTFHILKVQSP